MLTVNPAWKNTPEFLQVCAAFVQAGFQIYAVGGCVRDAVKGIGCNDIDLATDARPHDFTKIFDVKLWDGDNNVRKNDSGVALYPTGVSHGTWTVRINGKSFEITSFRKDVETDGRRAVVEFSDKLEEDAKRRDFTFNALYMKPDGEVIDPTGKGIEDLHNGIVRFVGDAQTRCKEDYLRILRLFRFYSRFGKGLMNKEAADAARALSPKIVENVSWERIWSEFFKIMSIDGAYRTIEKMAELDVFKSLFGFTPELHWIKDVTIKELLARPFARMHALGIMSVKFPISNEEKRRMNVLVELSNSNLHPCTVANIHGIDVAKDYHFLYFTELHISLYDFVDAEQAQFPVKSDDYIAKGFSGKELGEKLKQSQKAWWESNMEMTREELLTL